MLKQSETIQEKVFQNDYLIMGLGLLGKISGLNFIEIYDTILFP